MSEAVVDELVQTGPNQSIKKLPAYQAIFTPPRVWLLGIGVVGLTVRWLNIMGLPPFADEVQHTLGGLAAQTGKLDSDGLFNLIFVSRVLQSWILGLLYFLIGNENLLLWGRLFSGLCGLLTILSCYKIGALLYSTRAGLLAAALWAIVPYTLWHDRMLLVEPLLCSFTGAVFCLSIVLVRAEKRRQINYYAVLLGLSMAALFLTKFNGCLILGTPVLTGLFLRPRTAWKSLIPRFFLAYYVAFMLALPVLWLNRHDLGTFQREKQLVTPSLATGWDNFLTISDWFYSYLTLPLLVLTLVCTGAVFLKNQNPGKFLLVSAFIPLAGQDLFLKSIASRYFVFILVPLLVLVAGQLDRGLNWFTSFKPELSKLAGRLLIPALAVLALPMLWLDFQIVTDPVAAALPEADRYQYIEGPWNGTGITQVSSFLEKEQLQANKQVVVFTTQTMPSLGLQYELYRNPKFQQVQVDLIPGGDYVRLEAVYGGLPAYFVAMSPTEDQLVAEYRQHYPDLNFVPVLNVPKPGNKVSWEIYRLDRK